MEKSDFDSITTRVRHLQENIAELQRNYDQMTLNVKFSGNVQHVYPTFVVASIGTSIAQEWLTIGDPERKGSAS
ncbi:hypothetical protein ACS0TY_014932 [Phlomoides rotata]